MEALLQIAPQLAFAAFLFYVLRWTAHHFEPYLNRLLNSIDDIRETGQRMADIGERLITIIESQQEWQENLDALLTERHKRVMERFDSIDNAYVNLLYVVRDCDVNKSRSRERQKNEYE